jgi:hypothetical protein
LEASNRVANGFLQGDKLAVECGNALVLKNVHRVKSMYLGLFLFQLAVVWIVAPPFGIAQTRSERSAESARPLVGSWKSTDRSRVTVKTFRTDGTYVEVVTFLGARATVTGIYRLEGQRLWWIEQKLTVDRRGGDVLPPTGHVRLNEEQMVTIRWKGADQFVTSGDRTRVFQRVRP